MSYFLHHAIKVKNIIDHTAKPITDAQYLDAVGCDNLIFEPVTLEEVVATYFYDLPAAPVEQSKFYDAIKTTKNRIDTTMGAFGRTLNSQLNGTGIEAAQAVVGNPHKAGQFAVMSAQFPLSDGQAITIVFHSPTNDPSKITEQDELIAFRFLLNKRDVTHVVASSGGQDISLKQTTLVLANLAERNSARFQAKQTENKQKQDELKTIQDATSQLQTEADALTTQADDLTKQQQDAADAVARTKTLLDNQKSRNAALQAQLDGLKVPPPVVPEPTIKGDENQPAPETQPVVLVTQDNKPKEGDLLLDGTAKVSAVTAKTLTLTKTREDAKLMVRYTWDTTGFKYRGKYLMSDGTEVTPEELAVNNQQPQTEPIANSQPEPEPQPLPEPVVDPQPEPTQEPTPTDTANNPTLYWYGLRARPLGIGAQPAGQVAYIEKDSVASDPRTAGLVADTDESNYRWGVIGYATPLSAGQVSNFELVDFGKVNWNAVTRAKKFTEFKDVMKMMLDSDSLTEIIHKLIKPNGELVSSSNPFYDQDEKRYRSNMLIQALQEAGYTGSLASMIGQVYDELTTTDEDRAYQAEQEARQKAKDNQQAAIDAVNALMKGIRLPKDWVKTFDEKGHDGWTTVITDNIPESFDFQRPTLFIETPPISEGDEPFDFRIFPNLDDNGALVGTFSVTYVEGSPISDEADAVTTWTDAMAVINGAIADEQARVDRKNNPEPEPTPPATEAGNATVTKALADLQELFDNETNIDAYLMKMEAAFNEIEAAGATAENEPFMQKVADKLTALMAAEGVA